ncbi:MAG TPA: hypothetical protein VGS57_10605 [Thermoanaerobaculia bacterium]|jgi:hypothetical protein|nr:hypothetical protein [Thermoanaerobaculia bacterium]
MARILFLVGVVAAVLVACFARGGMFPWVLGALGIVTGILVWWERTAGVLIAAIALIVALSAILQQPLNPEWLSHLVFFVRLFVAHVALAAAALAILLPRPAAP